MLTTLSDTRQSKWPQGCFSVCNSVLVFFFFRYWVWNYPTCWAELRNSPSSSPTGQKRRPTACPSSSHSLGTLNASMSAAQIPRVLCHCRPAEPQQLDIPEEEGTAAVTWSCCSQDVLLSPVWLYPRCTFIDHTIVFACFSPANVKQAWRQVTGVGC